MRHNFQQLIRQAVSARGNVDLSSLFLLILARGKECSHGQIRWHKRQHVPFSNSSASSANKPHDYRFKSISAAAGPEPRGTDGCPDSLEKRDQWEWSCLTEKRSQCMQTAPSRIERACSSPRQIMQTVSWRQEQDILQVPFYTLCHTNCHGIPYSALKGTQRKVPIQKEKVQHALHLSG